MKTNSIVALASLLALVSATPLAKRVLVVDTKTEEVTMTVDLTTIIWVEPAAATAAPQQNYQKPAAKHGEGHQHLHTHAAAAAPSQAPQEAAPVPVQQPTSSSTPAPVPVQQPTSSSTPAPVPVQQPTSSSTPAPVAAYTPPVSSPAAYVPPVAPVAPVVAPKSSPVAPVQPSSGGACGTIGGKCSGDITYYQAGLGACGWNNVGSTEDVFALAHGMMGEQSNGNPFCGRMATIKVPGKATVTAKLVDKCMGCEGESIDLSNHLFDQLCDEATGRLHNVEWSFTS